MKKLLIAVGAVALAVCAQAAVFNWTSTSALKGPAIDSIIDNGNYALGTQNAKAQGTWNYTIAMYLAGTAELAGSVSGTVNLGSTGKIAMSNIGIDGTAAATAYDYIITITGAPAALTGKADYETADYIYSYDGASVSATINGSLTTAGNGATLLSAAPAEWTVSGIVKTPVTPIDPVPEPTTGLLLVLGVAGLALRRKN